ncbi:MAG: hypothetical protein AAF802_25145 [Planctomycetota bacterium]
MIGQHLSQEETDELQTLRESDRLAIKLKYWSLPEPSITDIRGDFDAELLSQGRGVGAVLTRALFGLRGSWLGKGFSPTSETQGTGYNTFGSEDDFRRELRMETYIDHSNIVPGHSFILDYRATQRGAIRWLRGELRMITSDLVLGIGTFGPRKNSLHRIRRVIPFVLVRSARPAEEAPELETAATAA